MQMTTIRVFFSKLGRAKYISHLDTMRTMTRALKRSGLPLWYTEGFNPHVYLTFALPIPLGYESKCESFDFRLIEEMPLDEVARRIGGVLPPGFTVTSAALPQMKPARIQTAGYQVRLYCGAGETAALAAALEAFDALDEITVTKRTKKGDKEVDIRPHARLLSCEQGDGCLHLHLDMAAGISLNINPTLYLDAFAKHSGKKPQRTCIVRKALFAENGEKFC